MTSIDDFIPPGTPLAVCPHCGEIYSDREVYMYFYDWYDVFEDTDDPSCGSLEETYSSRCPKCGESVDAVSIRYPDSFRVVKTTPPAGKSGFSLKPSGFSLPAPGKFSLFSRRKRR